MIFLVETEKTFRHVHKQCHDMLPLSPYNSINRKEKELFGSEECLLDLPAEQVPNC